VTTAYKHADLERTGGSSRIWPCRKGIDRPAAPCFQLDLYPAGNAATPGEARVRVRDHCHWLARFWSWASAA